MSGPKNIPRFDNLNDRAGIQGGPDWAPRTEDTDTHGASQTGTDGIGSPHGNPKFNIESVGQVGKRNAPANPLGWNG